MEIKEPKDFKSTLSSADKSVSIRRAQKPYLGENWHFHKEYEIIYFLSGKGVCIVGDHISNFQKGDLILVGKWLPHLFRNESKNSDFIVLKFLEEFEGTSLFNAPELKTLKAFLQKASRGFKFSKETARKVQDVLLKMVICPDWERYILNIKLLNELVQDRKHETLSSKGFVPPSDQNVEVRLQNVINYVFDQYHTSISSHWFQELPT